MNGILSEQTLLKIKTFRSYLLKASIWVFIGGVIVGGIVVTAAGSLSDTPWKIIGTLFILGLMMIISTNNLRRLEDRKKSIQIFALIGFVFNIVWALLWILACWGAFDIYDGRGVYSKLYFSIFGQLTYIATYLSAMGLIASNILAIKEGNKRSSILPLKITAVVSLIIEVLLGIFAITVSNQIDEHIGALIGFSGFVWFISTLVAIVLSKSAVREGEAPVATQNPQPQAVVPFPSQPVPTANPFQAQATPTQPVAQLTDEQLRAQIEQRVRAEMIEKEVRAKVEAELAAKNAEQQPPIPPQAGF